MNRKVKERLDSWDLKSLFLTILFLTIGLAAYCYFTDIRDRFRTSDEQNYKGQTKGEIIDVQKIDRITQSKWNGTKIFVDSYRVLYRYEVNGKKFEGIDVIPITTKNQKILEEILDQRADKNCLIKFDTKDQQKSVLVERE